MLSAAFICPAKVQNVRKVTPYSLLCLLLKIAKSVCDLLARANANWHFCKTATSPPCGVDMAACLVSYDSKRREKCVTTVSR